MLNGWGDCQDMLKFKISSAMILWKAILPSNIFQKIFQILQPPVFFIRFMGTKARATAKERKDKMDTIIRWIVRTAIDSFPISEKKKGEILQAILREERTRR